MDLAKYFKVSDIKKVHFIIRPDIMKELDLLGKQEQEILELDANYKIKWRQIMDRYEPGGIGEWDYDKPTTSAEIKELNEMVLLLNKKGAELAKTVEHLNLEFKRFNNILQFESIEKN